MIAEAVRQHLFSHAAITTNEPKILHATMLYTTDLTAAPQLIVLNNEDNEDLLRFFVSASDRVDRTIEMQRNKKLSCPRPLCPRALWSQCH